MIMPQIKASEGNRKTKYYKRDTKDAVSSIINRNSGIRELLNQMNARNIAAKLKTKRSKVLNQISRNLNGENIRMARSPNYEEKRNTILSFGNIKSLRSKQNSSVNTSDSNNSSFKRNFSKFNNTFNNQRFLGASEKIEFKTTKKLGVFDKSSTRNNPFSSSMTGGHSMNHMNDSEDLDDFQNSRINKRFNFKSKDNFSYQTVSSLTSIDSINQMKEQLKSLSDTLKMDIKSFKESTHFDSSKKVTASISKKNAPSKKQSKKKSLKDNGFVSNLAYITQQNKNSEIQDKKMRNSFSSNESDEPKKRK